MEKIKYLMIKYSTELSYLFFGVCTTLVNIVAYYLFSEVAALGNLISTVLAWLLSVLFAFFTNRRFVFKSERVGMRAKLIEMCHFFLSRVSTGALDVAIMYVAVDLLSWNSMLWKIISNVLVIILNYIFGKLIFKKK